METEEIVTDSQIDKAWGYACFGVDKTKREIIANALLKYACGYSTGYTIEQICLRLNLINKQCKLTPNGSNYLFNTFSNKLEV